MRAALLGAALFVLSSAALQAQVPWDLSHLHELSGNEKVATSHLSNPEKRLLAAAVRHLYMEDADDKTESGLNSFVNDLRMQRIHLTPDGEDGYLVQSWGKLCGATGNCATLLLDLHWRILTEGFAQQFAVLKTSSHGHYDLLLSQHESATQKMLFLFRFDGSVYRSYQCASARYEDDSFHALSKPRIVAMPCRTD